MLKFNSRILDRYPIMPDLSAYSPRNKDMDLISSCYWHVVHHRWRDRVHGLLTLTVSISKNSAPMMMMTQFKSTSPTTTILGDFHALSYVARLPRYDRRRNSVIDSD